MPRFTQPGRVKRSPFIVGIPVVRAGRRVDKDGEAERGPFC